RSRPRRARPAPRPTPPGRAPSRRSPNDGDRTPRPAGRGAPPRRPVARPRSWWGPPGRGCGTRPRTPAAPPTSGPPRRRRRPRAPAERSRPTSGDLPPQLPGATRGIELDGGTVAGEDHGGAVGDGERGPVGEPVVSGVSRPRERQPRLAHRVG